MTADGFEDVAALASVPPGAQHCVVVGGRPVLVCRDARDGRVWAVHNSCPHAFQPLTGGALRDGTLLCPKHGACFELATGRSLNAVTPRPLAVFGVRIEGERVLVSSQPLATATS
ncbi:Rieske (2Fe-2S) protein [Piscinibacter sp.]|uniref:Rieske (2Fe-2S) protein n=1 Tax=Piscinibacter sp. TaxID=1903157 RepID=UPI0039E62D87